MRIVETVNGVEPPFCGRKRRISWWVTVDPGCTNCVVLVLEEQKVYGIRKVAAGQPIPNS